MGSFSLSMCVERHSHAAAISCFQAPPFPVSTALGHLLAVAMFLILLSLISVSVADLDAKGACALQTKHRLEEGAKKVSVTCSADELICYDSTGHTQSCHPKSAGCPVTCPAGEHVCHTPAYCDTCDGYNWCSMSPCPLYCSMNETLCHDSTTMTDSCIRRVLVAQSPVLLVSMCVTRHLTVTRAMATIGAHRTLAPLLVEWTRLFAMIRTP